MAYPPRAGRCRLGEDAETPERTRDRNQLRRVFRHDLARESVQARDPALAIVACEAGVGRPLVARAAARAGASNHGCDEIAAREPMPVTLHQAEQFVTEHELRVLVGRDSEESLGDLPVGTADTYFQHSNRHLARSRTHIGDLGDPRCADRPGCVTSACTVVTVRRSVKMGG